ncbi:Guanine nucleotide-binding protein alpha-1 subunit [Morus notabilis]|uniref:Guanine nucleotide-binding protein alpha-1 subunit n=1 Tax=Morus notabilis TaxID=981085 RepID=W9R144_9ROSA|nr:extra-large guanine nucleotide-binding protein 1 isoform X2 [Morus notabilis]EXB63645.1 Guanine nucleotide-binding protein alpha-1 subunit [Morus notabilis]
MAAILRKLHPSLATPKAVVEENDDVLNLEYSMALEYTGPPVTYNIPHVSPVDFDQIPTAAVAVAALSSSLLRDLAVPVVVPIVKSRKPELQPSPSEIVELPRDGDYMNPRNWESAEESSLSSDVFSHKEEGENEEDGQTGETPRHARKRSVEEDEWSDSVEAEAEAEAEAVEERPPRAVRTGKKGSCYRCHNGNRFTEKEICIVCGAKYCFGCVLRAMGSMPEGRKCVSCIGYRIDEGRRGKLGKCSRLLKRLLTELEVEQIMKAEVVCKVNQLPANLVFVNGEPLSQEELARLKSCKNPPRKLKPGSYWYDNVSGFWGKEGRVYSQIISPQLNVGGNLKRNASNGNTNIQINNREITEVELWILKLAGVPCEGDLHYWVNPDGSYQEEGMNKVKGKIWDKATVKLACALLNLPIPSDASNLTTEEGDRVRSAQFEERKLNKFLLVGSDQSGTSTIFKQAKILYNVPFSEEERQNIKLMIQSKLYGYLGILLEGREQFEEESLIQKQKRRLSDQPRPSGSAEQIDETTIYSIGPRLKAFSDWLLKIMASGNLEAIFPTATREYAQFVEDLWNDAAIQATYNRRNELEMLPRAATYFLNRAIEISRTDYEPSDTDILYAEGITSSNSVASVEFSCPKLEQDSIVDSPIRRDPKMRCQLIRVHSSSLGENCKWLQMFEDVDMVLFCVALSDYDEFYYDGNGVLVNKMMASKQLFESIITHPSFEKKHFLLILNKFDLLEEKIDRVPLSRCEWFPNFCPVIGHHPTGSNNNNINNPTLANRAFHYIAVMFKRLFHSLTDRKLFVSLINGLESDTVDEALRYAGEILKWIEEKPKFIPDQQIYSTSIEASSSS